MLQNSAWFHTDGRILSANKQKVVRYNPKPKDLYELIRLIPDHWKQKIENNNTQPEGSKIKIKQNVKWEVGGGGSGWWRKLAPCDARTSTTLSTSAS